MSEGAVKSGYGAGRVVIFRLGSLGDAIVALPCFHAVARRFPDAERILLTNFPVASNAAPLADVLGLGGLVSDCVSYPLHLRSPRKVLALRKKLSELSAHTLVYLASNRGLAAAWRDLVFFRLCGFKYVVGLPLTRDLLENRIDPANGLEEPECERLARTLNSDFQVDTSNVDNWDLLLTEDECKVGGGVAARFEGRAFIAIHTGGKAIEKDWGAKNWRALLRDLATTHGECGLLLLGAAEEASRYDAIVGVWPGPVVNGCGVLTPRQCAATLRAARLFIGHDSGPLHLASVSGIPCVGLFGNYNLPRKWHPYIGSRCILHKMDGIATLRVAEVADAVRDLDRTILPQDRQLRPVLDPRSPPR